MIKILINIFIIFLFTSCVEQVQPIEEDFVEPTDGEATPIPTTPTPSVSIKINSIQTQNLQTSSLQVSWFLNKAGDGQVEYGTSSSYGFISKKNSNFLLSHSVVLENLSPNTFYHYRVRSKDEKGNEVVSKNMSFKTLKLVPELNPIAVSTFTATRSGNNYYLKFKQPENTLIPEGKYDTIVNNKNLNDREAYSGFQRTISSLDIYKEQCFRIESRYVQFEPDQFLRSSEVCVPAAPPLPVLMPAAPSLLSAVLSGENYILKFKQPIGSLIPDGGYDTLINNSDQSDRDSYSGFERIIKGLDKFAEQCFKVESRYTQFDPVQTFKSNQICVAAEIIPVPENPKAKLLFSSGFEGNTFLGSLEGGSGGYRRFSGNDNTTGFTWNNTLNNLWGSSNNGVHVIDGGKIPGGITNELQTVTGHDGEQTRALYQEVAFSSGSPIAQTPYQINDINNDPDEYYIKFWMKLDDISLKEKDKWRIIWQYKSDRFDYQHPEPGYRISVYIYSDYKGDIFWLTKGDDQKPDYWSQANKLVPVPRDEWFKFEVYSKVSSGSDGKFWAKINGKEIANHDGPNLGSKDDSFYFMMLWQLYSNSYPAHQWVDDIEVWDTVPY